MFRSTVSVCLLLLPLLPLLSVGAEGQRLDGIRVERAKIRPNLIPNASFEDIGPTGTPTGWLWDHRNTDSICTADATVAHGGRRSLHVTNGTPFGGNVYGTLCLAQPIHLKAGRPYTLSAWVRGAKPGMAWMGGGSGWQFRVSFEDTGGEWKRYVLTFTPGEADADFQPRINTDSPTPGFWVDDVKLEEGEGATAVEPPSGAKPAIQLTADTPDTEIEGDAPFALSFSLFAPVVPLRGRIEAWAGVERPRITQPLSLTSAGAYTLRLTGNSSLGSGKPETVRVRLLEGGHEIGQAQMQARFLSARGGERRLSALRARLPAFQRRIAARRAAGQDVSYPLVSYTVLTNFARYVEEDLTGLGGRAKPQIRRALTQLDELEAMATRLDNEIRQTEARPTEIGKTEGGQTRRFPVVPRWTGAQRPRIDGPAFLASTAAPGRRGETRPVFFTGYGHFRQVVDDIEKFPGYGVNIIQIELGPSALFPTPDTVNRQPIRDLQAVLRRAQRAGVAVCLLISPHYMPDWMLDRTPALRKRREGFLQYCLHAPEGQAFLKRFLGLLIPAIKDSPALHSICLSNEPTNTEEPCAPGAALWHEWLRKRHGGDIAVLNGRWGTGYTAFDQVPQPDPYGPPIPDPVRADYIRWNQEFFADWHRMLADEVHRYAPDLPVHAKAMTWTFFSDSDVRFGVDAGLFAGFSQINGNDSDNTFATPGGEFAQGWQTEAMGYDLQRSVLDAPVFNTENHLIPDRFTGYVPPAHVRAALWQASVHGQSATTIWVWERTFDPRSDFSGSIMHRPACAEAVGIVNCDLNRAAGEVTALQRAQPDVWILQSVTAATRDGARYTDCLGKLYTALDLSGLKVGFVTERQLDSGLSLAGRTVWVPNIVHLSDPAFRALGTAQRLWLVGGDDLLSRDEYDHLRTERLQGTAAPFTYARTTARDLWRWMQPQHIPAAESLRVISDRNPGEAIWGIEWRTAPYGAGRVLNLCNYRGEPMTVRIVGADGRPVTGLRDVLTGERRNGSLTLKPLEVQMLAGSW